MNKLITITAVFGLSILLLGQAKAPGQEISVASSSEEATKYLQNSV